jgi:hypothetical protein
MKKLLFLSLMLTSIFSFGQKVDSVKVGTDNYTLNFDMSVDTIGKFFLVNKLLIDNKGQSHKVKSVELNLRNGFLTTCRLITEKNIIFQSDDPIYLLNFKKFAKDTKLKTFDDSSEIALSSLVLYLSNIDNDSYFPSDGVVVLNNTSPEHSVTLRSDINAYLNVNVYSDLFALLGKESNGLVQTEVLTNINLNTYPFGQYFYVFHYIEPSFKVSKFDSKFSFQTVSDSISPLEIDRTKFNQLSYLDLGVKLNLFKIIYLQNTFDLINIGIDYKYSDLMIKQSSEKQTVNAIGYIIESKGEVLKYKNFGLRYSVQGYFQQIKSNIVEENNLIDPYLITEFSIFYYPKGKKQNMIFLRFKNFTSTYESNYYNTLQFGYSTNLNIK